MLQNDCGNIGGIGKLFIAVAIKAAGAWIPIRRFEALVIESSVFEEVPIAVGRYNEDLQDDDAGASYRQYIEFAVMRDRLEILQFERLYMNRELVAVTRDNNNAYRLFQYLRLSRNTTTGLDYAEANAVQYRLEILSDTAGKWARFIENAFISIQTTLGEGGFIGNISGGVGSYSWVFPSLQSSGSIVAVDANAAGLDGQTQRVFITYTGDIADIDTIEIPDMELVGGIDLSIFAGLSSVDLSGNLLEGVIVAGSGWILNDGWIVDLSDNSLTTNDINDILLDIKETNGAFVGANSRVISLFGNGGADAATLSLMADLEAVNIDVEVALFNMVIS